MFVTNEGMTSNAAASAGGTSSASNAIEIVGKPKPTTPFTAPASKKTAVASTAKADEEPRTVSENIVVE